MLAESMLAFRKTLENEGIIICYSGIITEDVLMSVGNSLKEKMTLEKTDKNTARNLFSIFVEQVQNIIRYSVEKTEGDINSKPIELSYGLITVGKIEGNYFVACANLVNKVDAERLEKNLFEIKNMDKDNLKILYKQILKGDVPEHSKGAGVGFVDIARKCSRGFDFDFMDFDADHAFFAMKAYI